MAKSNKSAVASKTTCAVSREQFRGKAKSISVVIDGKHYDAEVKEFSTGSFGWYLNGKVTVEIDGVRVPVQIGANFTIVGSKDAE